MPVCSKCKLEKSTEEFSWLSKPKNKRHPQCKPCRRVYDRSHYVNNPEYYKRRNKRNILKGKEFVRNYKTTTPCKDCKNFYHYAVMEFDHLPGFVKTANVADITTSNNSLNKIKEEIAKCDLVCANCHRMRTFSRLTRTTNGND